VAQRDAWRLANAQGEVHESHQTIGVVALALIADLEANRVLSRKSEPYKTSVVRSYTRLLSGTVIPEFGALRMNELTGRIIERRAAAWAQAGASGSTIRNRLMPLRVIYAEAVRNQEIASSPFDHIRLPKINGPRRRYVSWQEGEQVLAVLPDEIARVYAVALYAGLRAGEIGALRRSDVDLDARHIRVARAVDFPTGKLNTPKSGRERTVPIVDELLAYLEPAMMVATSTGFLFPGSSVERPFSYSFYRKKAREAQLEAGLDPISLHVLRHSFASHAATRVPPNQLRDLLGHASIETSMDWYVKSQDGWLEEARKLLSPSMS
jgi:integrase